jgi:hypothetical protein
MIEKINDFDPVLNLLGIPTLIYCSNFGNYPIILFLTLTPKANLNRFIFFKYFFKPLQKHTLILTYK